MSGMSGLDRYLEPPSCDIVEVEVIADCEECWVEQDVTAYAEGDEAVWNCPDCGHSNTAYWDDDPGAWF